MHGEEVSFEVTGVRGVVAAQAALVHAVPGVDAHVSGQVVLAHLRPTHRTLRESSASRLFGVGPRAPSPGGPRAEVVRWQGGAGVGQPGRGRRVRCPKRVKGCF